jgi:L-aspartate oxidase
MSGVLPAQCPVVIGAGLAGLMTALHLAPRPVVVLSPAPLGREAASGWAQGGLAAAVGDDDSPDLHLADTLAAGDGIVDAAVARRIVEAAPALVDELAALGVAFDRDASGRMALGLEAGHGRRRIVHARGDASGREILRAVIGAVRRIPSITVLEGVAALRLAMRDGAVAGVLVQGPGGPSVIATSQVVMATGGIGGLYAHSTNPSGAIGQGLVMAARAGGALADLEFVQFHPTALDVGRDPMPLVSEAVRGEGAHLVDETGLRFMACGKPGWRAELEPRDVVSRAVWRRMMDGHLVRLDAAGAMGARFSQRFPSIAAVCREAGLDPDARKIPVRPAAHYHMGGIAVDAEGRSSVPGLWACGEAASTGLHGANRLASNSLLEAAVTGRGVARSLAGSVMRPPRPPGPVEMPLPADASLVRPILSQYAGVLRDRAGLTAAASALAALADQGGRAADPACLGLMMVQAMLRRQESRGGHWRTDFPAPSAAFARRMTLTLDEAGHSGRRMGLDPSVRHGRRSPRAQ